ncbi:MAG TPA: AMP-binding protein [Steroidobacter sp.]|uniref:class I adenylate-forming enzyme family protein n=1 Tax=Steroidobacter sp. TaxID=1978227 RepID=UPI002ED9068B
MTGFYSLVDGLVRSAERYPGRCALKDGAQSITYEQLLERATAFCRQLRASGLQAGDRVALVLPNGADFIAACYGTWMAGGVSVWLNATAKARDFAAWLGNCDAAFIVAEPSNAELTTALSALTRAPLSLQIGMAGLAAGGVQHAHAIVADDPAVIMYTSGTTGRPKGVVLSHRNLAANTTAIVEYLRLTSEDSIVTVLPFYYSYGSSVLHTHLWVGGCLILEKNFLYPHAVIESLARERATGFAGVPSTYALLLSRVNLSTYDLSGIRYLTQAGGAMSPALTQKLRETMPKASLFVMYGQTEATARLTYLPPERLEQKLGSVGIPVPGVRIEIRAEDGAALPAGAVGEVWVNGPNVMLGYWRNEAATAEIKRDGWLKTGDMGRLDDEGFLYLVGRRSDMIKSGAHRIYPQDIEEAIAELPQVQEAAVVGVDDEVLGQAIRAFVVPAGNEPLTPMQVQAHCRARLANYKVPKSVEIVTSLPRTASGKVRRAELLERIKQ